MSYTREDFFAGKVGCRCDTREEYDQLMRECEAKGLRWNGSSAHATDYDGMILKPTFPALISLVEYDHAKLYHRCGGKTLDNSNPIIPFSALFLDSWAEFCAGKCYYHVAIQAWPEFRKKCKDAGIDEDYGDFINEDYYFFVAVLWDAPRLRHAYGRPPKDAPIRPFSAIARPEAEPPKPEYKVGDLYRVSERHSSFFRTGDTVAYEKPEAGIEDGAWFKRVGDGEIHFLHYKNVDPYTPSPKIIITTDGKTTTATLYEGGEAARRAASNEHNASYAALQALSRLFPGTCALMTTGQASTAVNPLSQAAQAIRGAVE